MQILLLFILTLTSLNAQNQIEETSHLESDKKVTCFKLIRDYLFEHTEDLEKKAEQQAFDVEAFLKRHIIYAVQHCQSSFNSTEDISKFVQDYESSKSTHLEELFEHMNNKLIQKEKLSINQNQIYEDYKMAEEAEAFYLFGYNLKKLPKRAKTYYLIVYAMIVVFALYTGLKDVEANSKPPKID